MSKWRVAKGEQSCYTDGEGYVAGVANPVSHVEKLVANAWFKAGYTTSHPGCFENPSRMVIRETIQ